MGVLASMCIHWDRDLTGVLRLCLVPVLRCRKVTGGFAVSSAFRDEFYTCRKSSGAGSLSFALPTESLNPRPLSTSRLRHSYAFVHR